MGVGVVEAAFIRVNTISAHVLRCDLRQHENQHHCYHAAARHSL
jgi:hypothetical protein